ncbi:N-acetylglucosamine kinase [Oscillatoria salina]|uniref:N-acetylglucosamine kinase n=1 Tax=Oscillatoria salina TaxID=331517 RepID=UPI001CCE7331|nr:BadF/BadG/BcrA/BcrD ATPase family protein [Oscillatoria salina]MBZ8180311.1 ATPase [Oscillatoria salina IIICB1]
MSYVLGIDGGGSKTICLLVDAKGNILGRGEAGSSNYHTVGKLAAFQSILEAISKAIGEKNNLEIEGICFGLAGVGRPQDREVVGGFIQQLQESNLGANFLSLSPAKIIVTHDAEIALVGGIGGAVGVGVIAGTGSIVFGCNCQGETWRVGGWGHVLGDDGSGYKIAISGLQAALKAYEGRSQKSLIQELLQGNYGIMNSADIIAAVYREGWGVKEIAALAPLVGEAANKGDKIARQIVEQAAIDLVEATRVTIDKLFQQTEVVEVVIVGSLWRGFDLMRGKFTAELKLLFPQVKVILPRHEPAYGASLLALKNLTECGDRYGLV